MTLVIDASVAIKWMVKEEGSEAAEALVGSEMLIAPDFLMLECANVLAQFVRKGKMTADAAALRLAKIEAAGVQLRPSHPRVVEAHRLAMQLGQTAYDCLYLALAIAESATMVTADLRFVDATQTAHPGLVRPCVAKSPPQAPTPPPPSARRG